jgi:hypothetical protein
MDASWNEHEFGRQGAGLQGMSNSGMLPVLKAPKDEVLWPWADRTNAPFVLGTENQVTLPRLVHQRSAVIL